jgi:hypothetical protein
LRATTSAVIPDGPRSGLIWNPEEFIGNNFEIPGSLASARAPE